jgi:carbamoyl-phosphate synthase large subunit
LPDKIPEKRTKVKTKIKKIMAQKTVIPTEFVLKVTEGRPNIIDAIINDQIDLILNTTVGKKTIADSSSIRRFGLETTKTHIK